MAEIVIRILYFEITVLKDFFLPICKIGNDTAAENIFPEKLF